MRMFLIRLLESRYGRTNSNGNNGRLVEGVVIASMEHERRCNNVIAPLVAQLCHRDTRFGKYVLYAVLLRRVVYILTVG